MTDAMKSSYHHGDLRSALLRSARILLEEGGVGALKLRMITRHAGVSATAATPHFGNLAGLLSALAAEGFTELADAMAPARAPEPHDVALAYVRFAVVNPGMFTLMFRSDAIDRQDTALQSASEKAFNRLSNLVDAKQTEDRVVVMVGLWGKVHGVAVLAIDGLLNGITPIQTLDELEDILKRVFL
ncbi:MAG: TetR/AcrR family transcriptional regulator [Acetobacter sp.]|nr:TetR/AcrR family transcriptional regulator [Acetobacter sp.]MCH4088477.1 TetR/AcrR family transcriptional regulator [Acetobacter sp.]MCI1294633.1 TetR/AcrR family transcriptional regulator [Acetobacter sp.]MCI1321317.1 TetR/AcrR family transcriptional regulator [Acetobacter sp.]MCI1374620.1 TetR/AcrR family transcriptional regulator [Acetobacter sp.]